ncbi:MAG: helix-turn-helix transcriptional regulator [Clostridia bacterium]|nr:helix-turn-helix transcriptional regulator [Clostridia bacterium]
MNAVNVGKFISQLRKEKELTQKELAEKLGVTDKAVSKWETGKCYPDVETIEKISHLFEVSINELLNGEKILPENVQEEADKTIINVMKDTKKEKHKGRIIALILSIITLISGFFAVYQAVNSQKNEHISLKLYSQNKNSVFYEISAAIYKEFNISSYAVCTESLVRYDKNGDITYIDMRICDNQTFKEISVKYWLNDETGNPQTSISMHQNDTDLNIDGIHFNKYINFLSTADIGKIVELSGNTTDYGYFINNDSYMWKTIEEGDDYGILPVNYSHLYIDGEIVPFTNATQVEGKVFEVAVFVDVENPDKGVLNPSCALINIPR